MSAIRIEVVNGLYENEDAYEKLICYISKPGAVIGACGVYPVTKNKAVEEFIKTKEHSGFIASDNRNLWHFFISFSKLKVIQPIIIVANSIALIFSSEYQTYYGIHTDSECLHVHFAVNAYSYHPNSPVLTSDLMKIYIEEIHSYLKNYFLMEDVTLQFARKRRR